MSIVETKTFRTWRTLLRYYRSRKWSGWAFRGQRDSAWSLTSTLDRAAHGRFGYRTSTLKDFEGRLLRRFQRQAHHFIPNPPPYDATLEWAALMQHHGAPTRLLDWTYSFYIAVFFALEALQPGQECATWAINYRWCHGRLAREYPDYRSDHLAAGNFLWDDRVLPGIFPLNPFRLNQRLVVQQGRFMAPGDLAMSFERNLATMESPKTRRPLLKLRLRCPRACLGEALPDLHRMNVTTASLFPGLDGFARGLEHMLAMPEILAIHAPTIS